MRYLWEVVLEAIREQIPPCALRYVHAAEGSAYLELALPCLNQTEIGGGTEIEVNAYYRFYGIFKDLFGPEEQEFPYLRDGLANVILHLLAGNDVRRGMTKEEYYKKLLATDIREGAYGEDAGRVFALLSKEGQEILLSGWLRSYQVGSSLAVFTDMVHGLIDDSIVYHNQDCPDEILIYTRLKQTQELERRIQFLIELFLDIRYRTEIFFEYHFGIIGMDAAMQIDEIAIY